MAGPIVTIIFKQLSTEQLTDIEEHLKNISTVNEKTTNQWEISSRNKKEKVRIGKQPDLRPFTITHQIGVQDFDSLEYNFLSQIGFAKPISLHIAAGLNDIQDHKYLAQFAIYFAEKYDGIIYLHGSVLPHRNQIKNPTQLYPYCSFNEALEFSQSIEGINHVYTYKTTNNTTWFSQFVNATYLQNWLANPAFRMVK